MVLTGVVESRKKLSNKIFMKHSTHYHEFLHSVANISYTTSEYLVLFVIRKTVVLALISKK